MHLLYHLPIQELTAHPRLDCYIYSIHSTFIKVGQQYYLFIQIFNNFTLCTVWVCFLLVLLPPTCGASNCPSVTITVSCVFCASKLYTKFLGHVVVVLGALHLSVFGTPSCSVSNYISFVMDGSIILFAKCMWVTNANVHGIHASFHSICTCQCKLL